MRRFLGIVALTTIFGFAGSPATAANQPTAPEVLQELAKGDAFLAAQDYEHALDAYNRADKVSHHTCSVCLLRIVSIYRKAGALDMALDVAKKAIAAAGDNKMNAAQAHEVRGSLLVAMSNKPGDKKLREAEEEYRSALALQPEQSVAHLNLGIVLIKQGRDAEGIAELKLYIAAPGNPEKSVTQALAIVANPILAREPFVPNFAFTSMEGVKVSNAALQGKVLLLDFWATWCPPCRESVPVIQALHKKYADKAFAIIGISADNDEETLKEFVAKNRMTWTEYFDGSEDVRQAFDIDSFPTYIVVDKEGVVRYRQSGFGPTVAAELEDTINKALKKPFVASNVPPTAAGGSLSPQAAITTAPPAGKPAPPSPNPIAPSAGQTSMKPVVATSAGIYHNGALGFSYSYPKGWAVASPELLAGVNSRLKATGPDPSAQQGVPHPGVATQIAEVIFFAGGQGKEDPTLSSVPSVKITSLESFGAMITPEVMKRDVEASTKGMNLLRGPEKFSVGDQNLYRMDFSDSVQGSKWVSLIQTVAYDHVLTIQILAASQVGLDLLVSTVNYSVFADADKK
jgi:thiol-disulfide isomerase/thioredoxin